MRYLNFTDEETAMIEGILGAFFSGENVSENIRTAYAHARQHLATGTLDKEDFRRIANAVDFAMKNHFCESCNRESQRVMTTILIKATSAF